MNMIKALEEHFTVLQVNSRWAVCSDSRTTFWVELDRETISAALYDYHYARDNAFDVWSADEDRANADGNPLIREALYDQYQEELQAAYTDLLSDLEVCRDDRVPPSTVAAARRLLGRKPGEPVAEGW